MTDSVIVLPIISSPLIPIFDFDRNITGIFETNTVQYVPYSRDWADNQGYDQRKYHRTLDKMNPPGLMSETLPSMYPSSIHKQVIYR